MAVNLAVEGIAQHFIENHRLVVNLENGELKEMPLDTPTDATTSKEIPFDQAPAGPFLFRERPFVKISHREKPNAVDLISGNTSVFHGKEPVELVQQIEITL